MPLAVAADFLGCSQLERSGWAAWFGIWKWFEWSRPLSDGGGDGCSVCWVDPAVCPVVDDGCVGSANEKHLYGGDKTLVVLHSEISNRKVLFE